MNIKNIEDIKTFILSLEKELPVHTWQVNHIDVWPIIRVNLVTQLRKSLNNQLKRESSNYREISSLSFIGKLKKLVSSYFIFFKLKKVDVIYTSTFSHRALYKNKYYNKFYDPILTDVDANGLVIEHNAKEFYKKKRNLQPRKSIFF